MSEAVMGGEQTASGVETVETDGLDQNAEQSSQGGGDDYWNRVVSDPEFAREQIVKRDQHSSKLANQVKELEPIANLVKVAGGPDALMELATIGSRIENTPGLKDVVLQAIQAGRYEPPQLGAQNGQEEAEEEWIDPDVKTVRDAMRAEMAELKQELASLREVAGSADLRSSERLVQENIEKVLEEFRGDPEAFAEASERINQAYERSYAAAQRGDAQQAALIKQLASGDGVGVLEAVTLPVYKKHAAKLVAAQNTSPDTNVANLSRSTDERNTNPTRPGAPQLPPRPNGMVNSAYVTKVLEAAARNAGIDPRTM